MAKNQKKSVDKSTKDTVNDMNRILRGLDNSSNQFRKANAVAQQKLDKMEEQQKQLRDMLGGITSMSPLAAKSIQKNESKPQNPKKAESKPQKIVQKAKTPTKTVHVPVKDLINQYLSEYKEAYAKDIFAFVQSKQPTSRASVYQTLKKHFFKKGEGVDAIYSGSQEPSKENGQDEAESYLSQQIEKEKDLNVS